MTCADLDNLLCDLIDGTIDAARKAELDEHLAACSSCAALARDAAAAVAFIETVAAVEPPPELLTRITFAIPGHAQPAKQPRLRGFLRRVFQPVLQPRFAMGMAMTILSFSMLGRFANIPVRQLTAADLNPREVWMGIEDRVYRAWNRGVKYYESMRLFVEIRSRLSELSEQDEEQKRARPAAAAASPTGKDAATAPQGSPKP